MSERIKQIQLKAWQMAHAEIGNPAFENTIANRAQDILVELVVTECLDILSEYSGRIVFDDHGTQMLTHPIIRIKEHFGVKY